MINGLRETGIINIQWAGKQLMVWGLGIGMGGRISNGLVNVWLFDGFMDYLNIWMIWKNI